MSIKETQRHSEAKGPDQQEVARRQNRAIASQVNVQRAGTGKLTRAEKGRAGSGEQYRRGQAGQRDMSTTVIVCHYMQLTKKPQIHGTDGYRKAGGHSAWMNTHKDPPLDSFQPRTWSPKATTGTPNQKIIL